MTLSETCKCDMNRNAIRSSMFIALRTQATARGGADEPAYNQGGQGLRWFG